MKGKIFQIQVLKHKFFFLLLTLLRVWSCTCTYVALLDGVHLVHKQEVLLRSDFDMPVPNSGRCAEKQILWSLSQSGFVVTNLEKAHFIFVYGVRKFSDLSQALELLIPSPRYRRNYGKDFFFGVECFDMGWGNSLYKEPSLFPTSAVNVSLVSCFGLDSNLITFKKNSLSLGFHRKGIDIVVPPEGRCEEEEVVKKSPFFQNLEVKRNILFYYSGPVKVYKCVVNSGGQRYLTKRYKLNQNECNRVMVRAKAYRTLQAWARKNPTVQIGRRAQLISDKYFPEASAKFCFNPTGKYGSWNTRLKRSVISGCIPVLVNINEAQPWEDLIIYKKFSVILGYDDIANIPRIVEGISEEEYFKKRAELEKVWKFFAFTLDGGEMFRKSMQKVFDFKITG